MANAILTFVWGYYS